MMLVPLTALDCLRGLLTSLWDVCLWVFLVMFMWEVYPEGVYQGLAWGSVCGDWSLSVVGPVGQNRWSVIADDSQIARLQCMLRVSPRPSKICRVDRKIID